MDDIDQQVLVTVQHGDAENRRLGYEGFRTGVTPFYVKTVLGMDTGDVLASFARLEQRGDIVNSYVGFLGYGWVKPTTRPTMRRISV